MDPENPSDDDNPFAGLPFFGDLSQLFGNLSGSSWEQARQIATSLAASGESEPNVDPTDRIAFEQIARVAELQTAEATGLTPPAVTIRPATRFEWASVTVDHYRPLLEQLGSTLGAAMDLESVSDELDMADNDPNAAFMESILAMLGPMMVSMTAGSMVGHLGQRSLGFFDLPIPRSGISEILVANANVTSFVDEWSLPADDVRLWVALHELIHHTVLSVPHVAARFHDLLADHASNFRIDHRAIEEQFGSVDLSNPSSMMNLQQSMNDPEVVLGAMQSDRQREVQPYLSALCAVVVGYVDHTMDHIGERMIGSYGQLSEALRRRRVTADPSDRFVGQMFGLELDQATYERGQAFAAGVVERVGRDGLNRLWESDALLPTPNEVDAPGLWLARIELPIDPPDHDSDGGTATDA